MDLKRVLAMLLSFCLLLSLMAVPALAEGQLDPMTQEEIPLPEAAEEEAPLPQEPAQEPVKAPPSEVLLMEDWDYSQYAECPVLSPNVSTTVEYDGTALSGALLFTPAMDGTYNFFSEGSADTYASLYDSEGASFGSDDDSGPGSNFSLRAELTAGVTYVLLSRFYSSSRTGSYSVTVTRVPDYITSISVSLKPGVSPLVIGESDGYWSSMWDSETSAYISYYYFSSSAIADMVVITGVSDAGDTILYNSAFSGDFSYLSFNYDCYAWTSGGENLYTVTLDAYEQSVSVSIPVMTFMEKYGSSPVLTPDTALTVDYDGSVLSGALLFTPAQTGLYAVSASSEESLYTYAELRDYQGRRIASNGSSGENGNFLLKQDLTAGETYVLLTRRSDSALAGSYSVTASRVPEILSFDLTLTEGKETLYIGDTSCGYWSDYYDYTTDDYVHYFNFYIRNLLERVTVTANLDDGTSAVLDINGADSDRAGYSYDCRHWTAGGTENTLTITDSRGEATASINIPLISFLDHHAGSSSLSMGAQTVSYLGDTVSGIYFFTPEVTGVYVFTGSSEEYVDTWGALYDDMGSRLSYADGGAENGHFSVQALMEAGKTYVAEARHYSTGTACEFTLTITRLPNIKELQLSLDPNAQPLVNGVTYPSYLGISSSGSWNSRYDPVLDAEVQYYQFTDSAVQSALSITAVYEDDTTAVLPGEKSDPRNELTYSFDCSAWTVDATAGNTVTVTAKVGGAVASIDLPVKSLMSYVQELGAPTAEDAVPTELYFDGESYSSAMLFTPVADGNYAVYTSGDLGIQLTVMKASGEAVSYTASNSSGINTWQVFTLNAGETYIIYPRASSSEAAGDFRCTVLRIGTVASLSIALRSPNDALVPGDRATGYWNGTDQFRFNADDIFSILEITATYTDGTSIILPYYSSLITNISYSSFAPGGDNTVTVTAGDVSASISVPVQGAADLAPVTEDEPLPVEYDGSQNSGSAAFTPEEDGEYWFYSEGDSDTKVTVTDNEGNSWSSSSDTEDAGSGSNFKFSCTLTAGKTYTILTKTYDKRAGKYFIRVSRTEPEMVGYGALKDMDLTGKMINLALVVDTTGSMSDEISGVRNALQGFVDALTETGATLRISLIDYKDVLADGYASTRVHTSSKHSVWFANADTAELKDTAIAGLGASGGGDTPESVVDALGCLLDPDIMRFNSNALKFAFVLTDANYWCFNNRGIKGMKDLVTKLSDAGIITSVVTLKQYFIDYRILTKGTGGVFINIRDDFSDAMASFAASIAARAADYRPDDDVIPVTSVSLGGDLEIPVGKVRSFTVQVDPVNATNRNVIWEIADTSVAEVRENTTASLLVIQGKKVGTTEVTARSEDGDYTATFTLTVSKKIQSEDGKLESCDLSDILAGTTDDAVVSMYYYADQANNATVPEDTQRELYLNLLGQDKSLSYIFSDAEGDLDYSWTFNGTDITDETKDNLVSDMLIELGREDSPAAEALAQFSSADSVDFAHEGALPGKATIQVPVDLDDGVYELWFLNEVTGLLEKVGGVTVKDGIASFEIEHCSTYVIADSRDAVVRVNGMRPGQLSALPVGDITVTLSVKAEVAAAADRQVLLVSYDAKGRFLGVKLGTLAKGAVSAEIGLRNDGRTASLRGFVVDALSEMAPLADAADFIPSMAAPAE